MFIDVVIQTEQARLKFSKGMSRHEIYDVYMKVPEHSICLEQVTDLFYPNKDTKGNLPHSVLALGRPGIGKTVLTRKIMHDWANGIDGFYHGKIPFHFEQLPNVTLKEFLQSGTVGLSADKFEHIFEKNLKNPQNAVLIFDGLNEFGGNLKTFQDFIDQSRMSDKSHAPSMSAIFLFIKILSGLILPGATVLVFYQNFILIKKLR